MICEIQAYKKLLFIYCQYFYLGIWEAISLYNWENLQTFSSLFLENIQRIRKTKVTFY